MRLVTDEPARIAAFVSKLIPDCGRGWPNCYAIGVERGGQLLGGMVFHNWSPECGVIEISGASITPRWLDRAALRFMFGYAFDQINCRMIVMRVSEHNETMVSIARRLGCKEYPIPDLRAEGETEVIFTLSKAAWRTFIGERDGQIRRADAA